jgi:hypothetical protein
MDTPAGVPIGKCTHWQVYPLASVPIGKCTHRQVYPLVSVPIGRCTHGLFVSTCVRAQMQCVLALRLQCFLALRQKQRMLWLLLFAPTAVAALQVLLMFLFAPLPMNLGVNLPSPALPVSPNAQPDEIWVVETRTVSKLILPSQRTRRRS